MSDAQGLPRSCLPALARTCVPGGWILACFHIITAIIGAGVLGLPHAMSYLGWVGGVVALVAFFVVTMVCSFMLADMYEFDGKRHGTYGDAVVAILGGWRQGGTLPCMGRWQLRAGLQ